MSLSKGSVSKNDVLRLIRVATANNDDSGAERHSLMALAGSKPGLWKGLEESEVVGVLREARLLKRRCKSFFLLFSSLSCAPGFLFLEMHFALVVDYLFKSVSPLVCCSMGINSNSVFLAVLDDRVPDPGEQGYFSAELRGSKFLVDGPSVIALFS